MKRILITSLAIFLTANISFCAPNYDPSIKPKVYSTEYNDKLLKNIKDDFHKKYPAILTYDKDGYPVYTVKYPLNAYRDEVITPFDMQRENVHKYIK